MEPIYRGMDRETLDAAYDNMQVVADPDAMLTDFNKRGQRVYEAWPCQCDLRYGEAPRQRYDWLSCGQPDAPTYLFIHGGYWQSCQKEDFAFVAEGPLMNGYNVILAEYTLAPEASMTTIVAEIKSLLDHLAADRDNLGIADRPLCLGGHSAGGHLTATLRSHPMVTTAHMISALVDLEPIRLSYLNDNLQLSEREVIDYSPLHHIEQGTPTLIAVGAAELPELVRHSTDYAIACEKADERIGLVHVPGCQHFDVTEDLAQPDGWQMMALARLETKVTS